MIVQKLFGTKALEVLTSLEQVTAVTPAQTLFRGNSRGLLYRGDRTIGWEMAGGGADLAIAMLVKDSLSVPNIGSRAHGNLR